MLSNNIQSKIHEEMIADFFRPKTATDLITAEIVVRVLLACYSITGNGANHSVSYAGFKEFIAANESVNIDASVAILEQLGVVIMGIEGKVIPISTIRFSNEFFSAYRRASLPSFTSQCVVYDKYYRVLDDLIGAYPKAQVTPWADFIGELLEIRKRYEGAGGKIAKTETVTQATELGKVPRSEIENIYEYATRNGFKGTHEEFLTSLQSSNSIAKPIDVIDALQVPESIDDGSSSLALLGIKVIGKPGIPATANVPQNSVFVGAVVGPNVVGPDDMRTVYDHLKVSLLTSSERGGKCYYVILGHQYEVSKPEAEYYVKSFKALKRALKKE